MNKRKIAILTYQDKYELYDDQLKNEFENTEVIQYGSDFSYETLRKNAVMIESFGYDAIVTRGFTAEVIKNEVSIPTIIVEPNMLDVLSSIIELNPVPGTNVALLFQKKNGLLKYNELPQILYSLFEINATVFEYTDMADYFRLVDELVLRRFVLCTGYNGIKRVNELGGRVAPLYVGENAMRDAVIEAIRIIDIRTKDADHSKKIETILSDKNEGIVNLDRNLKVIWINNYACDTLKIPAQINKGDIDITKFFTEISWEEIFNQPISNAVVKMKGELRLIMNTKIISDSHGGMELFLFFRKTANVVEEEKKIRAALHKKKQYAKFSLPDIHGHSQVMNECKEKTRQCAQFDANVLIYGESGVGKEMFAQCIHNESKRAGEPFYAINCAALPETLLESELFGYSEGSFTGAKKGGKAGIFELAHRGTVFLDEIGELPMSSQSTLLRVLQEKEIRRIGDDGVIPVDVRVIAASHKDIYKEVEEKRFRQDLFYRLSTVFLTIPPLRERGSDIMLLMDLFLSECAEKYNLEYTGCFDEEAYDTLLGYQWEGNVRELQNFAQRVFALGYYDKDIHAGDVEILLSNSPMNSRCETRSAEKTVDNLPIPKGRTKLNSEDIENALNLTGGNKTEAARILGISRTHLWRLMKENG